MIFDKENETLSRKNIKQLQLKRLKQLLDYVWNSDSDYKKKMLQAKISPDDIKSLQDIKKLPFTTKKEFREKYPHSFRIRNINDEKIRGIHTTSGTTGTESVIYFTEKDWDIAQQIVARMLVSTGITKNDIVDQAFPNGLPFAGKINHDSLQYKIGATVINIGIRKGLINQQILALKNLGATVFMGLPSYFLHILKEMKSKGINISTLKIKKAIFIGEPLIEEIKTKIKEKLPNIEIFNALGQTEMHGAIGECIEKNGFHLNEDLFIHEIINSKTGEDCKKGEYGEHVFTGLTYEAQPIIRYRSGDITTFVNDEQEICSCGRTSRKIKPPKSRIDNYYKIKGTLINPEQLDRIILSFNEILDYQIIISKDEELDKFDVLLASNKEINTQDLKKKIKDEINITPTKIKIVDLMEFKKRSWKTKKIIDKR